MRVLKYGCIGDDVRYLQYLLKVKGFYKGLIDGDFRKLTDNAVRTFQAEKNLTVDGKVGPQTRKALDFQDIHVHVFSRETQLWFAGMPYDEHKAIMRLPVKDRPDVCFPLETWAQKENADMVFNLAMFNFSDGATITYLKGEAKDIGYGGVADRVAINWKNVCGGYKTAIRNGKYVGASRVGKRSRNAVGKLTNDLFFIAQSLYSVTEYYLTKYMLTNYPVDTMLFEDGGGSTAMLDARMNALIIPERSALPPKHKAHGRPVASVLCARF